MILNCVLFCAKELAALAGVVLLLSGAFREVPRSRKRLPVFGAVCLCSCAAGWLLLVPRLADAYEYLDLLATLLTVAAVPVLFRRPAFFRDTAAALIF